MHANPAEVGSQDETMFHPWRSGFSLTGMPVEITLGYAPSIPSMRSPDSGRIRVKPLEVVHPRSAD
jgi:hypothetical protein